MTLPTDPQYPIYIVSKSRWKQRMTAKALDEIRVPYRIIVEEEEAERYRAVIDPAKILVLPFSSLGQGSIPARNWIWDHALASGAKRHWILDDNIGAFYRLNKNTKIKVGNGAIFRAAEDFVERYENIALAGFQYFMFTPRKRRWPTFVLNTRIYSCILIRCDLPYRWRGIYNEDTDLSIRILKDGWCTILFNAFLCHKQATMTMSGGNTDLLYQGDGRLKMAESLRDQHPDIVRIIRRWGRWQHYVDYRRFKTNQLQLRQGIDLPSGIDNYGMMLKPFNRKRKSKGEPDAIHTA